MAGPMVPIVKGYVRANKADFHAWYMTTRSLELDTTEGILRSSGYSLEMIARVLGTTKPNMRHYLSGRRPVPLPRAIRWGRLMMGLSSAEADRAISGEAEAADADLYRIGYEAGLKADAERDRAEEALERKARTARERRSAEPERRRWTEW